MEIIQQLRFSMNFEEFLYETIANSLFQNF